MARAVVKEAALGQERMPQIVVGVRIVGLEVESGAVFSDGPFEVALRLEHDPRLY